MRQMNCSEIRLHILRYLCGELTIVELAQLRAQVDDCTGCNECEKEREAMEMILSRLNTAYENEPMPASLRERIFAKLAEVRGEGVDES